MARASFLVVGLVFTLDLSAAAPGSRARDVTVTIVGTTDLHGFVFAREGRGGLDVLGGYLDNIRRARREDGGAMVLLDAGDTFQGGIESNLSEGAVVVDAYNALGYAGMAIGNHEFEFGAADTWQPDAPPPSDLRSALKARAAQARFPLLAANLHEDGSPTPVEWPNVRPSAIVVVDGVHVGLVGVMTRDALAMTLAANVRGLSVSPLATAIEREATRLRGRGAHVIVVTAHAGGACARVDVPHDTSSCDDGAEIFDVVRGLPRGLVDVVVAGHTHADVAHEVAGVAIVQAGSWGRAFSRVDVSVDRRAGRVVGTRIFPPRQICAHADRQSGECVAATAPTAVPVVYEGRAVTPSPIVRTAMAATLDRVRVLRATPVGTTLAAPVFRGDGGHESPLANAFADALRALTPGTDAALTFGAGPGGVRVDLPAGPLTVGALYDAFPFDNRVVRLRLPGSEVRRIVETQLQRSFIRGRALGISGLRVRVSCAQGVAHAAVTRADGTAVNDTETLNVATLDFMVGRGPFPVPMSEDVTAAPDAPLVRDVVWRWFRNRGAISLAELSNPAEPRWARVPESSCLN